MPLRETKGAASAQGFGAGINSNAAITPYVDDVFSTYLYTGNGSSQTIQNGIDLATKGGLVWTKARSVDSHNFVDTVRGKNFVIQSNNNNAQGDFSGFGGAITSFNNNGYSLGVIQNDSAINFVSWTFRKAPKFFDVVTYTGDGTSSKTIPHNLQSIPGMIFVKSTNDTASWFVYHTSLGSTKYLILNGTNGEATSTSWANTNPTTTSFFVGNAGTNASGTNYVAYLFANDTSTNGIIQCGSFSATAGTDVIKSLGWEPQYVLVKQNSIGYNWIVYDTMRGMPVSGSSSWLFPNSSDAETNPGAVTLIPTATGFTIPGGQVNTATYIYMAIRRPNKPPTSGTEVFSATYANNTTPNFVASSGVVDLGIQALGPSSNTVNRFSSRLQGAAYLESVSTASESANSLYTFDFQSGWLNYTGGAFTSAFSWMFKRAPGFFDEVCYTGDGNTTYAVTHNLGVTPELAIIKCRSNASTNWIVAFKAPSSISLLRLNTTAAAATGFFSSSLTSTTFVTGTGGLGANETTVTSNLSGSTYVAYLFATLSGVSKVGSYTGTGATQTINCGFTGGARFVIIKRTDTTGDWYVWDTARGMVSGTDPSLLLNSTAAEVNANSVYTVTTGFQIVSTAAGINASGGSYIFFAVA